ncbi:MAG: 50S ribosomal protein L17 [Bacteroidetes bacterium]|jgi:large subunit ribosomal protein L17|nr:50S ribosomal protein L17 [Bacteroidota bacterium]
MRHRKKGKKLGRDSGHRKQTLAALSSALIEHKRIQTTLAKAKALRPFVEPLITRSKQDTTHNRKQVFRYLQDKEAIKELFGDVADQVGDRPGGYTRIIKLGQRSGDGAEMAMIELVDYNDVPPASTGSSGSRTRRGGGKGRRGSGSSTAEPDQEPPQDTEEAAESEPAEAEAAATEVETPDEAADEAAEAEEPAAEAEEPAAEADGEADDAAEDEDNEAASK